MDEIKPTPRNKLAGLLADALQGGLEFATNNGKNKPMNLLAELLALPAIQKTADRLSYGEPLTTGKGFTTRLQPETFDAAMGVLPFAGSMGRGANYAAEGLNKGAAMIGKAAAPSTERLVNAVMAKGGLPAQLMQDMAQGTKSPAIVWHGSPHKFAPTPNNPLGEFDFSKIGTGEGAQAYGYGGYLGGAKATGEEYRKALTGNHNLDQFNPTVNGDIIDTPVVKNIIRSGRSPEDFIISMQRKLDSQLVDLSKASKADELGIGISDYDLAMQGVKDTKKMIDEANGYIGKNIKNEPLGYLYKVDLPDEHIAKMLDWDKTLSQQHPDVQGAIGKLGINTQSQPASRDAIESAKELYRQSPTRENLTAMHKLMREGEQPMGSMFYRDLQAKANNADASALLRDAGIPGIKYLDGGSRGAGQGSSNYVVFPGNERLLKILERNGESVAPKTKFEYPIGDRDILAQQRAALPLPPAGVDITKLPQAEARQYGLGLRADNTALERANASKEADSIFDMNFNNDAYHGSNNDIYKFNTNPSLGDAVYTSPTPDLANYFANANGANIMPLKVNASNIMDGKVYKSYDEVKAAEKAKKLGKSGFKVTDEVNPSSSDINTAFFNPDDIRSRFAAFDPWRRNAAIAASMGVAAPDLLAKDNNELASILKSRK